MSGIRSLGRLRISACRTTAAWAFGGGSLLFFRARGSAEPRNGRPPGPDHARRVVSAGPSRFCPRSSRESEQSPARRVIGTRGGGRGARRPHHTMFISYRSPYRSSITTDCSIVPGNGCCRESGKDNIGDIHKICLKILRASFRHTHSSRVICSGVHKREVVRCTLHDVGLPPPASGLRLFRAMPRSPSTWVSPFFSIWSPPYEAVPQPDAFSHSSFKRFMLLSGLEIL
jgi:hypothetical protein